MPRLRTSIAWRRWTLPSCRLVTVAGVIGALFQGGPRHGSIPPPLTWSAAAADRDTRTSDAVASASHACRFTGWTDVGLTEKGVAEAHSAGAMLRDGGFTFDIAYTSVLQRAIKTLWIVLDEMGLHWIDGALCGGVCASVLMCLWFAALRAPMSVTVPLADCDGLPSGMPSVSSELTVTSTARACQCIPCTPSPRTGTPLTLLKP